LRALTEIGANEAKVNLCGTHGPVSRGRNPRRTNPKWICAECAGLRAATELGANEPGPERVVDLVHAVLDAGASGVMFCEIVKDEHCLRSGILGCGPIVQLAHACKRWARNRVGGSPHFDGRGRPDRRPPRGDAGLRARNLLARVVRPERLEGDTPCPDRASYGKLKAPTLVADNGRDSFEVTRC
jgi:hypothetical protein